MFWNRRKKRALEKSKELEGLTPVSQEQFLAEIHDEAYSVQKLQALLVDIKKLKERAQGQKKVRNTARPSRKRKSSSRK